MNTFSRRPILACTAFLALTLSSAASTAEPAVAEAAAAAAAARCESVPPLPLQRRVIEHGAQGVDSLRRYVERTRMIHQLELYEAAGMYLRHRAERLACISAAERGRG